MIKMPKSKLKSHRMYILIGIMWMLMILHTEQCISRCLCPTTVLRILSLNLPISVIQVIAQSINISGILNEWQSTDNFALLQTIKYKWIHFGVAVKSDCNSSCLIHVDALVGLTTHIYIYTYSWINIEQTNFVLGRFCCWPSYTFYQRVFFFYRLLFSSSFTWTTDFVVNVMQKCWPVFH